MLLKLVQPMRRSGSSYPYFLKRIPADVRRQAIGRTFDIPLGDGGTARVRIAENMQSIRVSLRTRDPAEAKIRQAGAAAYIERAVEAIRRDRPVVLTPRHAHALAAELYRAWADGQREGDLAAQHDPVTGQWTIERPNHLDPEEEAGGFAAAARRLAEAAEREDEEGLEPALGPIVDRLLLAKGIASVDPECRPLLLNAFRMALQDAFAGRQRNAEGDYSPDPKAGRFPEWTGPEGEGRGPAKEATESGRKASVNGGGGSEAASITSLLEGWQAEANARGLKPRTQEVYRSAAARFSAFLGHDDASRVTPEDVLRFKDHRLASAHPIKAGKHISPDTINSNDLAGLKAIFGWGVANRKLPSNPAKGIFLKPSKKARLRSPDFTDAEAKAILSAAYNYRRAKWELPQTAAAKRWVPWLCAYTGARVGEMVQLRKQDVRREGDFWVVRITPEAGTVKTNKAREVVLHPHLVEQGFAEFVAKSAGPYLFLAPKPKTRARRQDAEPADSASVAGRCRGVIERLTAFVRTIVTDPNVSPNHAWRHRFKTVGIEAGMHARVLNAIQGHASAPGAVADSYGRVTLRAIAEAIAKLPRYLPED